MAQHYTRKKLRAALLDMYRDNAMRSQSYMDVHRLHLFMTQMTELEVKRFEAANPALSITHQLSLF